LKYFFSLALFFCCLGLWSQAVNTQSDSITPAAKKRIYSRPRTASLLSTIIPGAGQVYNKKYWKVPLIYAGLGGFGYMFLFNNDQYNKYRSNVIAFYDDDSSTVNNMPWLGGDQLQNEKLYYRQYRDFAFIGFAIVYVLNIIDANVDAHLKSFDISDDLSMKIRPWEELTMSANGVRAGAGIRITFNFR
jgi:hypothetical protein